MWLGNAWTSSTSCTSRVCAATPHTPVPEVHLLSNGRYSVVVTNSGGGYSRWRDLAVTRFREDATTDQYGQFCYVRDLDSGEYWSAAYQPAMKIGRHYEAIFPQARAEFRRRDNDIDLHTEISVSPEDDIELRRVTITNFSRERRRIEITSYAEVVLAPASQDLTMRIREALVGVQLGREEDTFGWMRKIV